MYAKLDNFTVVELSETSQVGFIEAPNFVTLGYYSENGVDWTSADCNPYVLADRERIEGLWQAAHDYEFASVNGSGVGLVTMGVLQGLPKALSVQLWVKSIWEEYYLRKANGSQDLDFSVVGNCPHSIPELMSELGI